VLFAGGLGLRLGLVHYVGSRPEAGVSSWCW